MADALAERADVWRPLADERGVRIDVDADPGVRALVTPDRLAQVLDNLLANALAVAPASTTVRLGADRIELPDHAPAVEVRVVDAGPGLSDEERERAFDRFWRTGRDVGAAGGDREGASRLGGSGLGLAIVKKLVEEHAGHIEAGNRREGGARLVILLPVDEDARSALLKRESRPPEHRRERA
jgi:signal transduction histidine kinase